MLQALQEPHIDLCQLLDALDGVTLFESLGDGKDTEVSRVSQLFVEVIELRMIVAHEAVHALSDHAQTLLDHLLKRAADTHNLAHGLHRRTDLTAHACKLRQVPAGDLADHIVELRSHVCTRCGAHLANLIQRVSEGDLGSYEGEGIAGGLTCKCRGAAQAGVDLDDTVVVGLGVECELNITLTDDAQMLHALDGDLLQHLHLLLLQRACRSHHNRLSGVDAERVEVLHRGHGEAAVIGIADALELDLLPALQRLLYKDLRRKGEGRLSQLDELLFVGADTRSETSEGIGRADHDGEADLAGGLQRILHRLYGVAHGHFQVYLAQLLHKEVAILCVHDSFHAGAKHLYVVFFQCAVQVELRAAVQGRLAAEGQQDAVRALLLDDFCHEVRIHRLEIHLVCNTFTGLDSGDVWVNENALDAFFAKGFQCL